MTDRYSTLTVALEHDIREDDAQALISAIKMLRGVLAVSGAVTDAAHWMSEERARHELGQKLLAVVYPRK